MKSYLLLFLLGGLAQAHRLDEYLQAALIAIEPARVEIAVKLTPGVEMYPLLNALVDSDGDGTWNATEEDAYVAAVLRELRLELDGRPLQPVVLHRQFPPLEELREGMGSIRLQLVAQSGALAGGEHRVLLRNLHRPAWSVYLMNALQPPEGILIEEQRRDPRQQEIEIRFRVAGNTPTPLAWSVALIGGVIALRFGYGEWARRRGRAATS